MEMIQQLQRMDITSRESKIIWFLIGKLQGDLMIERLIKSEEFVHATTLHKQHVSTTLKSLIAKGIIQRKSTEVLGCHWYRFHEENFGRVHAVKKIKTDVRGLRLVHSVPQIKLSTNTEIQDGDSNQNGDPQEGDGHQVGEGRVTEVVTLSRSNSSQSSSRDENISQREKELLAHEERKREQEPRGGRSLADVLARFRNRGTG